MDNNQFYTASDSPAAKLWVIPGVLVAMFFGWFIAGAGLPLAVLFIVLPFLVGYLILVFLNPRIGLISYIVYCFAMPGLSRQIVGPQFGLGVDALLILTWLGVIFYRGNKYRFRHLNNDLNWLAVVWFIITVLQIANPERPSIIGWLQEMRSTTFYWILTVPLTMMVFNRKSDLYFFLDLVIFLSLLGALYGVKQLYFGVNDAENRWLEAGASRTHVLFGKLRVFSFYSEAAQFGASQSQVAIMCIILLLGPHGKLRKLWYLVAGVLIFYGMLISGTRGALGGIAGGAMVFMIVSRQLKLILIAGLVGLGFIAMLKFTYIGHGNDQIRRMRSGTNANDPSLQVRLVNQKTLSNMLKTKPFGTGVGTIGMWGVMHNKHIPTSKIPPDSYFVKVWAMYGIVGFIIWFGMMLFILGKSIGVIWNVRDPRLRNQLCALCAGYGGILLCSYGNEVMNAMPSSAIVYVSWALIWLSPRWDTPAVQKIAA